MSKLALITLALLVLSVSLVIDCAVSSAQSGRRTPKPSSPAIAVPTPEATATPTPTPPRDLLPVLVGIDDRGGFANFPPYFYASATQSFVKRLSQDTSLQVNDAADLSRGEAIKKAKGEKTGYVVYLQLRLDTMNPNIRSNDARDAVVEYTVFAPVNARVVSSGRTYARTYQNKGILRPTTSGMYSDYMLDEAAKAAAEQVGDYLRRHRPTPPD